MYLLWENLKVPVGQIAFPVVSAFSANHATNVAGSLVKKHGYLRLEIIQGPARNYINNYLNIYWQIQIFYSFYGSDTYFYVDVSKDYF